MKSKQQEQKDKLIRAMFCRSMLYIGGFLTENENGKVFDRIRKFQDRHKIEVTKEELDGIALKIQHP